MDDEIFMSEQSHKFLTLGTNSYELVLILPAILKVF